jgi:hypothetical protein
VHRAGLIDGDDLLVVGAERKCLKEIQIGPRCLEGPQSSRCRYSPHNQGVRVLGADGIAVPGKQRAIRTEGPSPEVAVHAGRNGESTAEAGVTARPGISAQLEGHEHGGQYHDDGHR